VVEAALDHARAAARGKDVRIGGGAATIRPYLEAGLFDEMHLAISPILLGQGEPLLAGIDLPALSYRVKEHVFTEAAMHLVVGSDAHLSMNLMICSATARGASSAI
jgi:dihydrofolate reductase